MSKFTKRELFLMGSLLTVLGGELWQRRKLKTVLTTMDYHSRLSVAATRVAQNVRSLLDVEQILKAAIEEIVPAFGADQCVVRVEGGDGGSAVVRFYPAEEDSALMQDFDSCRTAVAGGTPHYYVRQGHTLGRGSHSTSVTTRPLLGTPIAYGGRFLGALMVRSNDPARIWSDSEVQALLAIAHQVWEAVIHARLFAEKDQLSLTDALTGCLNRRGFDLRLDGDLRLAAEAGLPLSLVMVDIDHFKRVNDTYGHAAGDQVLQALADVLREEINDGA